VGWGHLGMPLTPGTQTTLASVVDYDFAAKICAYDDLSLRSLSRKLNGIVTLMIVRLLVGHLSTKICDSTTNWKSYRALAESSSFGLSFKKIQRRNLVLQSVTGRVDSTCSSYLLAPTIFGVSPPSSEVCRHSSNNSGRSFVRVGATPRHFG